MRFGNCVGFKDTEKLRLLAEIGFDYVECNFSALSDATEEEIETFVNLQNQIGLPCETANVFFKGGIPLTGESVSYAQIEDYLAPAFAKASRAGIKRVVFGSGGARKVPEGFCMDKAYDQLIDISKTIVAPYAAKHDMIVVIEELNKSETNIVNSIADAMRIVDGVGSDNVKLLLDLYHIGVENDPIEQIGALGEAIQHVHIANPLNKRYYPRPGDSPEALAMYKSFFAQLKAAGYDQRVSIEGGVEADFEAENRASLALLRELAE